MTLLPIELMKARVQQFGEDSDTILFSELLYAGELITKMSTAAFVAGIEDDRENNRYRLLHGLVRADGLGDWVKALDEALAGPASQLLAPDLSDPRRTFTERVPKGTWQNDAVSNLQEVLAGVHAFSPGIGDKVALRQWFSIFAELRNKTRGHGALTPATCARLVGKLKASIELLFERNPLFGLPWAYLQRNLSGKYKVVALAGDASKFEKLKTAAALNSDNYADGVYIWANGFRQVELIHTDLDVSDYYLPNGAFRNGTYELHSLISDSRLKADAAKYMSVASDRPGSETEGASGLDVIGRVYSNIPDVAPGYVQRRGLETEIRSAILNDRHPIVTLVGRGGIGKTSLSLSILREIAETKRFDVIVWFSSRDIDLTMSGAKPVQPRVLTDQEIAEQYRALIDGLIPGLSDKTKATSLMSEHLRQSPLGATLFVFDNFETLRSPVDLFQWLDTNIRLPNKVVITTRFRDFKADYPIEVSGMEQPEAEELIMQTAEKLGIAHLIGRKERETLIEESDRHPYVIKIMLGEIADAGTFTKPKHIIARKDEILDALFERTYGSLTPMAGRIFLMLSGWRSLVPQLAVEAVLLRHGNEGGDAEAAIDQLIRMSLIQSVAASDGTIFLEVPLTAALFGRRKLEVSPSKPIIENDIKFLQDIGPTAQTGLREGLQPRVEAFFKKAARKINDSAKEFEALRPVLEFLARGYPPAWMLLSKLEQEVSGQSGTKQAAEYVRRYLESQPNGPDAKEAWQQLFLLYRLDHDAIAACSAFLKVAEESDPPFHEISEMAKWINRDAEMKIMDSKERRALCRPLAMLMEERIGEASATDLSRLAWLYLHSGDDERARRVTELGLQREPDNMYCMRLAERLRVV